ncbi:MAG: hypothetical protein QF384_12780 [Alphaproteobacteria bacterium]|nr:hypothetical protein [Alphaproteobacteria bacterium]
MLIASINKTDFYTTGYILMRSAGNRYTTGLAKRLQPGRNIDAITEYVIPLDNQIAEMNTDTEDNAFVFVDSLISFCHGLLNVDYALDGIDDGGELQQQPIAHRFDDTTAVLGNLGINQFITVGAQGIQRASLIHAHQARIADHVSRYDSCQSALGSLCHAQSVAVHVQGTHALLLATTHFRF